MTRALQQTITTAHERLDERLALAHRSMDEHADRREIIHRIDAFLAYACRHTAAVCDLVLPAARHSAEGRELVRRYLAQCRRAERAIVRAKQRMYGEARSSSAPWPVVWGEVVDEVHTLHGVELDLVEALDDETQQELDSRFADVAEHSPTRPHPHSPHVGRLAHLGRRLWARADRIWDAAEGRIVTDRPAPPAEEPDGSASAA